MFINRSKVLLILAKPFLRLTCFLYNSKIYVATKIGSDLFMSHCIRIIINVDPVFRNNVNISHQITICIAGRGDKSGVPEIGNCV